MFNTGMWTNLIKIIKIQFHQLTEILIFDKIVLPLYVVAPKGECNFGK